MNAGNTRQLSAKLALRTQDSGLAQTADLLLHGAEAKPPAKLVSQIDHEGVYPLRFA